MLSKAEIKFISSLGYKKYRERSGKFVAEGAKVINELLAAGFILDSCFALEGTVLDTETEWINVSQLKKISHLSNPNNALAVFVIPKEQEVGFNGLTLALDGVRDPGNLGTIIRLCDWFGINDVVCSLDTVDCFNPKVVQSSMGSLARVRPTYVDLANCIAKADLPVYASAMSGTSVYEVEWPERAILLMGNEGKGISDEIFDLAGNTIGIPSFGSGKNTESLNVAMATAILLNEFRRPSTEK